MDVVIVGYRQFNRKSDGKPFLSVFVGYKDVSIVGLKVQEVVIPTALVTGGAVAVNAKAHLSLDFSGRCTAFDVKA